MPENLLKTFALNLKQTASDLLSFLKKPTDSPDTNKSTKDKGKILLRIFVIVVLLDLVLMGLIQLVKQLGWHKYEGHGVVEMVVNSPVWQSVLLGVFVIPFIEELIFRSGLRFRKIYFTLLVAFVLTVIGLNLYRSLPILWAGSSMAGLAMLMGLYLFYSSAVCRFLERIWPKIYGRLFYVVAIIFGLMHIIINYKGFEYSFLALLLIPVLIAPQIWGGLTIGYMRVKYGFIWGYFLHMATNALFLGMALIALNQTSEKLNISNENYSLKVEERIYKLTESSSSTINVDTAAFVNTKLNDAITQLLQAEDVSIVNNTGSKLQTAVNLYYKSETPDITKTKATILAELQQLYKFDVTKANVEKEMWEVEVENNTALAASASDRGGIASEIHVDMKGIEMHNVTIEQLIGTLQKEYRIAMADKTADTGRYNFTFSNKGFEELKAELKEKYGLALQSKMIEAQQVLVEFRK